jgi:hypothetical protein
MTPLAAKIARQLTLPVKKRTFDNQDVLALFGQDMHCFDISAIAGPINDAMQADNVWPDVGTMLPNMFLPSPVTWLEFRLDLSRVAYVISSKSDGWFHADVIVGKGEPLAVPFADFRPCPIFESPDRIAVRNCDKNPLIKQQYEKGYWDALKMRESMMATDLAGRAAQVDLLTFEVEAQREKIERLNSQIEIFEAGHHVIAFAVMAIDLINTPGLVGLKQHAPHADLARQLARTGVGKYPLRAWSEVMVKTHTTVSNEDHESGLSFRKCLHFVRSHQRHYRDGRVSIIPAHWRGDPALGIKRTRYRVAA